MNKGWFIPTLFAGAAACFVGLWSYLSNSSSVEIARRHQLHVRDTTAPKVATPAPLVSTNIESPSSSKDVSTVPIDPAATPTTDVVSPHNVATLPIESDPPQAAIALPAVEATPAHAVVPELRAPLKPLIERIASRLRRTVDDVDFQLMELDRHAVRWRSNIGREPWVPMMLAWGDFHRGDLGAADREFARALSFRPNFLPALRGRVDMFVAVGLFDRAATAMRAICKARPEDADAQYNLGVILSRAGQWGDAADAYRFALKLDPRHAASMYNLAAVAQRDGRLSEARDLWERFASIEPSVISVWFNLGVVYMDYGEPLAAARCFDAVVSINPEETIGRINLAIAYLDAGHLSAAEFALLDAMEIDPCDPAVIDALAESCRRIAEWLPRRQSEYLARAAAYDQMLADSRPDGADASRLAGDPALSN